MMRQAAIGRPKRVQESYTVSVPAPIDGWNRKTSVAAMKPTDAILIKNWFPQTSDIIVRKGSSTYATGLSGRAETLAAYRPESGPHQLFAWAGGNIYNVTATGAVGAPAVTGLTNSQWQTSQVGTSGGHFLLGVNGADQMRMYNGATWTALNSGSTPPVTGVDTADLIGINVFKQRPFYIENGSMSFWYPAVGAFAGALTRFDMSTVFKNGGYLMAMGTWTVDGGLGLDDYAVFITSQGEVAVYQGSDPSDANDWALRGVYNVAPPIGRRCMIKYGADLLIITTNGVLPASTTLIDNRKTQSLALTDRIQGAMSDASTAYRFNTGWSLTHFPDASMLLLNIPISPGREEQYVMNTVTGRWCQFTGWPASSFEVLNNELYFGSSDGAIVKAWNGTDDRGAVITTEVVPAFSYFGKRSQMKQFTMFRIVAAVDINPQQILANIDVDYVQNVPSSAVDFPVIGGSLWDVSKWDQATWGGIPTVQNRWYSATGIGYCAAAHIKTISNRSNIRILAIDYLMKPAGVL